MATKPNFKKRICNIVPSHGTENDWGLDHALAAGVHAPLAAIPASKDLRAAWWAINDQGDTGSCVGWATADGVLRYHMVKAGKLDQKTLLSVRFIWMSSKETDTLTGYPETFIEGAGTTLKAAVDISRKFGVVPDAVLPFKINTLMYSGDEKAFFATAAQRKISSYFNLGKDPAKWRAWIANNGPILAALNVDKTWDDAAATKGKLDVFQPNTTRGGHAITVVGYTQDRFIIRNSWGTGWGDKGFGYASEAYIAGGFANESYGVVL